MTSHDKGLEQAVAFLCSFTAALDDGFETAARTMLELDEELKNLSGLLENLKGGCGAEGISESHKKLQSEIRVMFSTFDEAKHHTAQVLPWLRGLNKNANIIALDLGNMVRACTDLMLLSINAKLVALDEDSVSGRTFTVITEELNTRSREIRDATTGLSAILEDINDIIRRAETSSNPISNGASEEVEKLHKNAMSAVATFDQARRNIFSAVAEAESRMNDLRPQISRLMSRLQEQDILKQSLEHIIRVLRAVIDCSHIASSFEIGEAAKEDSIPRIAEEFSFARSALHLSTVLYKDTASGISTYFEEISRILHALEQVGEAAKSVLGHWGERRVELLCLALLPMRTIPEIHERIRIFDTGLDESLLPVKQVSERFRSLARKMDEMRQMSIDLSVIENAMQIKTAKTSRLSAEATLLSEQIADRDKTIRGGAEKAVEIAQDIVAEAKRLWNFDAKGLLASADSDATKDKNTGPSLEDMAENFDRQMTLIAEVGEAASDTAATFLKSISAMQQSMKDTNVSCMLTSALQQLETRQSRIESIIGTPLPDTSVEARLQMLVDRFAVLSQKKIAESITDLTVEDGDEGGELTLF